MSPAKPANYRRTYTTEFRQGLVAQCQPGVPVSTIALSHGINAGLLRKWIKRYRHQLSAPVLAAPAKLVAVQVELPVKAQTEATCSDIIEINLTKRTTHITIRWPGTQAKAFGHLLKDLLK